MSVSDNGGRRITRIALTNWRNFAGVNVELQRRVFLVGPNASGKSNFLDAVRFLRDIAQTGGGLQDAVRKRRGLGKLWCLAARAYRNVDVEVWIGTDDEPDVWQYELSLGPQPDDRTGRSPGIVRERVCHQGQLLLARPNREDENDSALLTQTHLEQVTANRKFREVAEFLSSIRYMHIVPQLVRDPDRSRGIANDPFGGDFIERVGDTHAGTRGAHLRRIRDALRVVVPQLSELQFQRDKKQGTAHLRGKYEHWRAPGAWQTEEEFSDGTLRLIGLLWAVLEVGGPLLLEEPELSLHPEVVRHIPQMLHRAQRRSRRQILVSTHSADLLRDDGVALDEVLLLQPDTEGTSVTPASSFAEVEALVEGGLSVAEAVIPRTAPKQPQQLSLFPD